jgi:hypothetical protein
MGVVSSNNHEQTCTFAAQWLAYALPCQRFANTLTHLVAAAEQRMRLSPD